MAARVHRTYAVRPDRTELYATTTETDGNEAELQSTTGFPRRSPVESSRSVAIAARDARVTQPPEAAGPPLSAARGGLIVS